MHSCIICIEHCVLMAMNEDEFNFENDESIGGNSSLVKSSQGSNTSSLWSGKLGRTKSQRKKARQNGILSLLLYHLLPKDGDDEKSKRLPRKQIQNHSWNRCHHLSRLSEAMEVVVNRPFLPDKSNDKDIIKTLPQHPVHVLLRYVLLKIRSCCKKNKTSALEAAIDLALLLTNKKTKCILLYQQQQQQQQGGTGALAAILETLSAIKPKSSIALDGILGIVQEQSSDYDLYCNDMLSPDSKLVLNGKMTTRTKFGRKLPRTKVGISYCCRKHWRQYCISFRGTVPLAPNTHRREEMPVGLDWCGVPFCNTRLP